MSARPKIAAANAVDTLACPGCLGSLLLRFFPLALALALHLHLPLKQGFGSRPAGFGLFLCGGIGGRWDVSQWAGYTGGDSQNKGGQGIGAGRRQIVGPRPLPGAPNNR